jgi:hypothetical protein
MERKTVIRSRPKSHNLIRRPDMVEELYIKGNSTKSGKLPPNLYNVNVSYCCYFGGIYGAGLTIDLIE